MFTHKIKVIINVITITGGPTRPRHESMRHLEGGAREVSRAKPERSQARRASGPPQGLEKEGP